MNCRVGKVLPLFHELLHEFWGEHSLFGFEPFFVERHGIEFVYALAVGLGYMFRFHCSEDLSKRGMMRLRARSTTK